MIAALAVAYSLSALFGLMFVVPPGFASPVFPPSGIALASVLILGYRCWPGVFAGSLATILWVWLDAGIPLSALLLFGTGIAAGAALQAVAGAYLVRRFAAFPVPFSDWRKVVSFLFWGGPASCLINAIIGVSVLSATGRIVPESFLYNAVTWWIGDTFGVLVFTPLILIWTLPRDRMRLAKRVTVTVPAAITFALAILIAWYATSWERSRIRDKFDRQATFLSSAFEKSLYGDMIAVTSLQRFVKTVGHFDQDGFHEFASGELAENPGIHAFGWNPVVRRKERAAFEADIRRSGIPDFRITERSETGRLRRARDRPEHVVVRFIVPHDGNEAAVGYDIASNPVRRQALDIARDSGHPIATGRIDLVQETARQAGILVVSPVYEGAVPPGNPAERRRALKGYVVGVLRVGDIVEKALGHLETTGVVFRIIDESASADQRLLYENMAGESGVEVLNDKGLLGGSSAMTDSFEHEFGGRQWTLVLSPTRHYIARYRPQNAWMILSFGLLLSSLVVAFTVVLVGRNDALSVLVKDLTAAKAEAVEANDAKSEFLAAMSHDLRTPLNAIMGFSELMQNRIFGKLGDPRYDAYARDIHRSGKFLLNLINDLLDTSKIEAGKYQLNEETVDVSSLIGDCVRMISPMTEQAKIRLITHVPGDLASLRCDSRIVAQTLNNLLSNAVKFTREGGEVRTTATMEQSGGLTVKISDTGIGMSEAEKVRALEPFG